MLAISTLEVSEMDGVKGIFDTLETKYNSASGPWKWGIGGLILLVALAMIGYYIYKWMIFTVNQDERVLRKTFGVISMEFENRAMKEMAKTYLKSKDIIGSDPAVLESFGKARVGGPGPKWRFFGLHSFIVINVRPRNFQFPLYVQRDPGNRYNAFTANVTVVVRLRNIFRWFMANYEPEQIMGQILGDGFRQVVGDLNFGPRMFEVSADRHALMRVLADKTHDECVKMGVEIDNLFMDLPEERTDTMMPEVIKEKDFFNGLLEQLRVLVDGRSTLPGPIVITIDRPIKLP
jgi:hypothetical protein